MEKKKKKKATFSTTGLPQDKEKKERKKNTWQLSKAFQEISQMHKSDQHINQLEYENRKQQGKEILETFIRCLAIHT